MSQPKHFAVTLFSHGDATVVVDPLPGDGNDWDESRRYLQARLASREQRPSSYSAPSKSKAKKPR